MVKMEFEGKTYTLQKNSWIDSHNSIDPSVQTELYKRYFLSLRMECMTVKELADHADLFMNIERFDFAEKCCREAVSRSETDIDSLEFIYPRLTSCLRKLGHSGDVVKIYRDIQNKYGANSSIISHVLLTSVGAAYCDLNDWISGEKCAKQAWRKATGVKTPELRELFRRIDQHFGRNR